MTYYIKKSRNTTKVINGDFDSIPWDEADRVYKEAGELAIQAKLATLNRKAKAEYDKNEELYQKSRVDYNPEAGSYEGSSEQEFEELEEADLDPDEVVEIKRSAGYEAVESQFVKAYIQKSWSVNLLSQITHKLSQHKINNAGAGGTIEGQKYLMDNFNHKSAHDRGLYRFLMLDARGKYLDKMGVGESKEFCTLVPLILYAHKRWNSVPYTKWDRETLHFVVNQSLHDAMLTEIPEFDPERLLELQHIALQKKEENKLVNRSAITTYMLYRLNDTELGDFNTLTRHMILQTWAAHPSNRTKYMILDPMNWDEMPVPLISTKLFESSNQSQKDSSWKVKLKRKDSDNLDELWV